MRSLRKGQRCPLHNSYFCCGRNKPLDRFEDKPRFRRQNLDVRIVEDPHHPRGFREICSSRELQRRKWKLAESGIKNCFYCHEALTDYRETDLAHIEPKGMGGGRRDDSWENLTLAHRSCNNQNGSKRPPASAA